MLEFVFQLEIDRIMAAGEASVCLLPSSAGKDKERCCNRARSTDAAEATTHGGAPTACSRGVPEHHNRAMDRLSLSPTLQGEPVFSIEKIKRK